jgi:hypothetical protein
MFKKMRQLFWKFHGWRDRYYFFFEGQLVYAYNGSLFPLRSAAGKVVACMSSKNDLPEDFTPAAL